MSVQSEKILHGKMLSKDMEYFNNLKSELKNQKIVSNINDIYCLLFNECININNDISQKKMICSSLKKYLSNIINEISEEFLKTLEDKISNNNNTKSQRHKSNKKILRITIKLLFLILVFMINKYKQMIESTFDGCVNKGINVKSLKTNQIREELFFLIVLEQNLYWMEIIFQDLITIFQNLRNNKYRMLINADFEFNNLDQIFKKYCFDCFLNVFNIIKKYSSIKLNETATRIYEILFNDNLITKNKNNNCDNLFLPLNIAKIDNSIFNLFECFVYEFLYDIDSLWKYCDNMNLNENNDIYELLYGFGIYLCEFLKLIVFNRDESFSKVDFFNFYFFSYKLMTDYFAKLNKHLYQLYNNISDVIQNNFIIVKPDFNLNYLQNLSNSLKDLLFNFMISSYNNDTLKEAYSFNEILMNSIISHCFIKTIISIYSLISNNKPQNLILEILNILLDNINKYKIKLPLKCHFHKELMTHNFLLILDDFLINNEKELILYFQSALRYKKVNLNTNITNLINKFNEVLSCLFNHYNSLNFIYSNHIMFKLNEILSNAGITLPELNFKLSYIFLRFICSNSNTLNYKDIPISEININEKYNPNFSINLKHNNNNAHIEEINFDNVTYNKELALEINNVGFVLDKYLDKNTIKLFNSINNEEYELINLRNKNYLVKNSKRENYSVIFTKNDGFIEKLGIDDNLKENILNIMENNQYTDKTVYKLIQEKVINPGNANICVNVYFNDNIKYYDLKFEMNYFEYQNKIKELLI